LVRPHGNGVERGVRMRTNSAQMHQLHPDFNDHRE